MLPDVVNHSIGIAADIKRGRLANFQSSEQSFYYMDKIQHSYLHFESWDWKFARSVTGSSVQTRPAFSVWIWPSTRPSKKGVMKSNPGYSLCVLRSWNICRLQFWVLQTLRFYYISSQTSPSLSPPSTTRVFLGITLVRAGMVKTHDLTASQ